MLRQATRADIPAMQRVRLSVRENRSTRTIIAGADYLAAIETTGRGWVIESEAAVMAWEGVSASDNSRAFL
jgi:hypothetical protein